MKTIQVLVDWGLKDGQLQLLRQAHRFEPIRGLAHGVQVGLARQQLAQPLADDGVVVGDQDANLVHEPPRSTNSHE